MKCKGQTCCNELITQHAISNLGHMRGQCVDAKEYQ